MNANRLAVMLIVASPVFIALPAYAASAVQPNPAPKMAASAPPAAAHAQSARMPHYAKPRLTAADRSADHWNQVSLGLAKQNINLGDKPLTMSQANSPRA